MDLHNWFMDLQKWITDLHKGFKDLHNSIYGSPWIELWTSIRDYGDTQLWWFVPFGTPHVSAEGALGLFQLKFKLFHLSLNTSTVMSKDNQMEFTRGKQDWFMGSHTLT